MYLDTEPFRTVSLESSHMNYHRSLSPPGPGLDCHKVSTWSQFLHHSAGNTQNSQPRIPRNHQLDLRGQSNERKRSNIVSYICSCYRSGSQKVSPGNWLDLERGRSGVFLQFLLHRTWSRSSSHSRLPT